MITKHKILLTMGIALTSLTIISTLFLSVICFRISRRRKRSRNSVSGSKEGDGSIIKNQELIKFSGGENLSMENVLNAHGEVIGKSSYGTLYKAILDNSANSIVVLRFLRPSCTLRRNEVLNVLEILGSIRHPNLVPLNAFYGGDKEEKLMVHPFYEDGNLAHFIRGGTNEAHKWPTIYEISLGIAKGIHHLHTTLENPIIHGNLKSKNVFIDRDHRRHHPYVSDFGLHLVLNPYAGQQMLESSACYKAPELIKMKDVDITSDVYSLGVIFLELITGKLSTEEGLVRDNDFCLTRDARSVVFEGRIVDFCHPEILVGLENDERAEIKDRVRKYFSLAVACCSPSPVVRPDMNQVVEKLHEIGECNSCYYNLFTSHDIMPQV